MPDIFTKAKRSQVMSRIRSRGNQATELALVRVFRAQGITGWRRHLEVRGPRAEGRSKTAARTSHFTPRTFRVRPDFVFPRRRLAVFVDGCFWHGCPWHGTRPKGNAAFWRRKFARNRERDREVNRALRRAGWRVLRIWEHALRWAKVKKRSTAHPKPSPPAPLPSDGRGWRRTLPVRGGEGEARRQEARLLHRLRRALAGSR